MVVCGSAGRPAFQRVEQRAEIHAHELGRPVVTGANMLIGIFPETRSPAAQLLGENGITLARAIEVIAGGTKNG